MTPVRMIRTALWTALHNLQYGFHISALNGIQSAVSCTSEGNLATLRSSSRTFSLWSIGKCVPMTDAQFGLIVSIFTLGGLSGSLLANHSMRHIGKVSSLRLSAVLIFVGSGLVATANSITAMIVGRLTIGVASGLSTVIVPIVLHRVAPQSLKQSLGIFNQLFIVLGILLAQGLALPLAAPGVWRWVLLISMAIALVQLLISVAVEDLEKQEEDQLGSPEDRIPLLLNRPDSPISIKKLVRSPEPKLKCGLRIILVTQSSQQLCGVGPVMYFSTRILAPIFGTNARHIALLIVLLKIPATLVPMFLIKRMGSKSILLFSALSMSCIAFGLAISINFGSAISSTVAIVMFVSAFSFGLGPITWVVMSEVIPSHARGAAGSIGLAVNWSTNFLVGSVFLPLQQVVKSGPHDGDGNVFFVFSGTCLLAWLLIKSSYRALERVESEPRT